MAEESELDVNARLVPPPMPRRRIRVKLKPVSQDIRGRKISFSEAKKIAKCRLWRLKNGERGADQSSYNYLSKSRS